MPGKLIRIIHQTGIKECLHNSIKEQMIVAASIKIKHSQSSTSRPI